MVSKKKLLAIIFAMVLVITGIIVALLFKKIGDNSIESDIENSTRYKISDDGAILRAFNSIPKETVEATKEYIINNGYNSDEIKFNFHNSKSTFSRSFPSNPNDVPFVYYVGEIYKNIWVGYLAIDENGNVVETQDLMTEGELSEIQIEPDIGSTAAIIAARGYLDLSADVPAVTVGRRLYNGTNIDEVLFCYMIKFEEYDNYIYINGITGERIE